MFAVQIQLALVFAVLCPEGEAPIRGRLLDHLSGYPVPHFAVTVELRGREPIRLETDAEGRFETPEIFRKTRYSLGLQDHARSPEPHGPSRARVTHDPEAREGREAEEFRIDIGPTFALQVVDENGAACADPEQFDAFLYHDRPLARALPDGRPAPCAPVRAVEGTWVRFRDRRCEVDLAGGPWWLELRSLDGTRGGGTRIESLASRERAAPIRVVLEERAVLTGRIVDESGAPVAGAELRLKQAPDLVWHEQLRADPNGGFRFKNLVAREYELQVCDPRLRGLRRAVSLQVEAPNALGDVEVVRLGAGGLLSGRITSRSGMYDGAGSLLLEPLDKEPFGRFGATLHWETLAGGQRVADFEVEAPADDRYRVVLDTLDIFDWGAVTEASLRESPLAISLDDRTQCLDIRVTDAQSKKDVADAELALTLGLFIDWDSGAHFELEEIPLAIEPSALCWCVTAPGYVPVWGDLNAFSEQGEDCRKLQLELEPRWGNRIEVYDRRTLRPLDGVLVRLDGELAGRTQNGGLDVQQAAMPETLDLSLDGWRWVGGSEDYRRFDILEEEVVPTMLWMIEN